LHQADLATVTLIAVRSLRSRQSSRRQRQTAYANVMPPARENSSGASPSWLRAEVIPSFGIMELQEASDYESGSIEQNFNT